MTGIEDIRYREIDGHTLEGRLYRPDSPNGTWLVDVHGGAWGSGDRLNNAVIHEDLAAHGVGTFALDFRLSDVAQYPDPVQDAGNERLVAAHNAYFAAEADMDSGNPYRLLERDEATHLPPMIVIQGTEDANVDHTWQDAFADLYRSRGGTAEVRKFDGMPHTFVTNEPEAEASKAAIVATREFVLGL